MNGKLSQFDVDDLESKHGFIDIENMISLNLLPPQGIIVMAKLAIFMTVL